MLVCYLSLEYSASFIRVVYSAQKICGCEMMFDYKKCFDDYCSAHNLALHLSFSMPVGYETANGNFDPACKTVFINAKRLKNESDSTKAFFLFHELRHALQYLCPDQFSSTIQRSIQYIILYDGTCYKLTNERYLKCQLDGGEEYFTDLYLSQPHEVDANTFAYKSVKKLYGDSEELKKLFNFWMPRHTISDKTYDTIFLSIDEKTKEEPQ